jgi:S1-C subfamily serine protease
MKKWLVSIVAVATLLVGSNAAHASEEFITVENTPPCGSVMYPREFRADCGDTLEYLEDGSPESKTVRIHGMVKDWMGYYVPMTFTGTGFFIKDGYVVTAQHVVDNTKPGSRLFIEEYNNPGIFIEVQVVDKNANLDLAVLKTPLEDHPYFEIADSVSQGEAIYVVGNTHNTRYEKHSGVVQELSKYTPIGRANEPLLSQYYRTISSVLVIGGFSGGPAFNDEGEIIGVNIASLEGVYSVQTRLQDLDSYVTDNAAPRVIRGTVTAVNEAAVAAVPDK